MKLPTFLALSVFMLTSCGLFGKSEVPKELIDGDLAKQTVDAKESGVSAGSFSITSWDFSRDTARCFSVNNEESKYDGSNADITITVSAFRDASNSSGAYYPTVFGKMLFHYKKENAAWKLDKIEPKELVTKGYLEKSDFEKFMDIQMPICKYYRYTSYSK